ncbi:MAG: Lrp/AsnC family transcriptional regulator [Halobacteriota archaeon]|nr:Lrp/AsnC family transcriptional regulator [Halobacteriota archaeon]
MDDMDRRIIGWLSSNSRTRYADMAGKLGVATSTIHNRIRRLEELGVIEQFTLITDPAKMGNNITAYIGINIDYEKKDEIVEEVKKLDLVLEFYELLEPYDLFLKVRTDTIESLKRDVLMKLSEMDGVHDFSSILTTKRHKELTY